MSALSCKYACTAHVLACVGAVDYSWAREQTQCKLVGGGGQHTIVTGEGNE